MYKLFCDYNDGNLLGFLLWEVEKGEYVWWFGLNVFGGASRDFWKIHKKIRKRIECGIEWIYIHLILI